ncbi:unnamed protein product, partial [marine sediment metagenome]
GDWPEVADIGMYSPISLANFDIRYPVFNAGLGIERLAMILYEVDDMRKLAYPQFSVAEYADDDIAGAITYITSPKTARGKKIARVGHLDHIQPYPFSGNNCSVMPVTVNND